MASPSLPIPIITAVTEYVLDSLKKWHDVVERKEAAQRPRARRETMKTRRDEGWAWVVLVGGFLTYTLVFGIVASNGVVYAGLHDVFGQSASATAWVTFTMQGCLNIFSPLAGIVGRKISYRFIVMIGGVISSLGLVLSYLASTSMDYLYVTYGIVLGFGLSCTIAPTAVIIGLYFDRHRALANGVCFAGSGVGAFLIPPLVEWLRTEYGLRGAFLCVGGIALNIVVCSSVFRKEPPFEPVNANTTPVQKTSRATNEKEAIILTTLNDKANEKLIIERSVRDAESNGIAAKNKANIKEMEASQTLLPSVKIVVDYDEVVPAKRGCWSAFQESDARFFSCGMFLLVACGWSVTMLSLASFVLIIPSFASSELKIVSRGDSTFLVSALAAGDIFGRLGFGWFIDLRLFPNKYPCMISLLIAGLTMMLSSQATTFPALLACGVAFGIAVGCCISIHPILLVDYLGLRGFQRSFGYLGLIAGVAILSLSSVIGILKDSTGSYQSSLYFTGGLVFFVGLLWLLEPVILRFQPLPSDAEILRKKKRYCDVEVS